MIRSQKFQNTFSGGIDGDSSVNKIKNTFYLDADNMRLISNDPSSSGALTNIKGNQTRFTFPSGDVILGFCKIRGNIDTSKDSIVFFTYNASAPTSRIYLFEGDPFIVDIDISMNTPITPGTHGSYSYKAGLIYANSGLGFNTSYPIKAEGRYESANIRKIYWVDGLNNIRYMILDRVDTGDPVTIFDINPTATLSTPTASVITGGAYTAGMVQYSYQLYVKNGAATTYSPASDMLYLTAHDGGVNSKTLSGSNLGDNTGKASRVVISNLDLNYNRIRIVAIHYTEYTVNPTVKIIGEFDYATNSITVIDNGYTIFGTIPIEEYRLFGQVNFIANSLATKNNYLFFADIIEDKWNPDWLNSTDHEFWDSRAIRFKTDQSSRVDDTDGNISFTTVTNPALPADWISAGWDKYNYDHNGINLFNDTNNDGDTAKEFKYQSNGSTLGAEGPNIVIEFTEEDLIIDSEPIDLNSTLDSSYSDVSSGEYLSSPVLSTHRSSQRTEVYRMYIVFFNTKMQYSNPQWINDLRMPFNDEYLIVTAETTTNKRLAKYLYPKVTVRNLPVDANLYGWQIFRCERGSLDRSVLANGIIGPLQYDDVIFSPGINKPYSSDADFPYAFPTAELDPSGANFNMIEMISPEIVFNKNLSYTSGDKLRVDGRLLIDALTKFRLDPNQDTLITMTLGRSYATHVDDTLYYNITDGQLQSLGITHEPAGGSATYPSIQVIGGYNYRHTLRFDEGGFHWFGNKGTEFIMSIQNVLDVSDVNHGVVLGSYIRNVFTTQYGGNTYESRTYNSVIPYSSLVIKATSNVTCYRGDTFITVLAYLRSSKPSIVYDSGHRFQQEMLYIPCESSINSFYRSDEIQKYYSPDTQPYILQETLEQALILQPLDYPLELGNLYRYNPIYSKAGTANLIQNIIFDSNNIEHSDVRIIATGKKINNEYFDNWTNLYLNNNIELDAKFGPIRNIFTFNNKLYSGQDKAIAVIAVNDRSMIQDNSALQLILGTGGVLDRFDYLTTSSGFQDYSDMALSDNSFYYFDRRNKIIYTFTDKGNVPISEINGYRSFLKNYDNISTVKTGYDPIYKEVFFYITDGTIDKNSLFDEYTNSFIGKHTFSPSSYGTSMFNLNDQFYSIKDNKVYLHNYGNYGEFYGVISDSTLTDIINPNGNTVCRFDVLELRVDVIDGGVYYEKEQFDDLTISNNYQTTTKSLHFSGDDSVEDTSKALVRKWRIPLLPDDNSTDFYRFADTYLRVKLSKDNTNNKKIVLHDITSYIRTVRN
jgi:hypothetical protein